MGRTLLLLLTLSLTSVASAQSPGWIVGTVVDAQTGLPVPEASVTLIDVGRGAVTDSAGAYRIGPLPFGPYTIEVHHVGYRRATERVVLTGGETTVAFRLTPRVLEADEIVITAHRAVPGVTPVTFTNISRVDLRREHTVKDPPALLQDLVPGVYAYADAGSGVGYSYLKIRGFDQKRINVMINGIPLNDPEDHQVYWIDMPDLLSSTQDVQVQRGVGTALVGQYGLGGSVNIVTTEMRAEPGMTVRAGLGSWGTRAFSFQLTSISAGDRAMEARFSRILSDGYRDRTASDLWAYFLSGRASSENLNARLVAYGGPIKTHAGWYAAHEESLTVNRRFNPVTYENEIDSFNQPHYELHLNWAGPRGLDASSTVFYVRGRGYYEQYKQNRRLRDYGVVPIWDRTTRGDVIRQKHVAKDHVGWLPRVGKSFGPLEVASGGEVSAFWSTHWGTLLWTDYADTARGDYYRYRGKKWNLSWYVHGLSHLGPRVDLLTDLSLQHKRYSFRQEEEGNFFGAELNRFETSYTFLSPRVGLMVRPAESLRLYANVSGAQREPADDEYFDVWEGPDELFADPLFARSDTVRAADGGVRWVRWHDPQVSHERLIDYETGAELEIAGIKAGCALYLMRFEDEIIPYGRFDEERGAPVTGNAPRTEHKGVELDVSLPWRAVPLGGEATVRATGSFSRNVLREFVSYESGSAEGEDLSGNPIPLFPNRLLTVRAGYRRGFFEIGGRVRHVGKQYLDTSGREDRTIDPWTVGDASLAMGPLALGRAGRARVELRVENLTNVKYETSGYYDSWEGARYLWVGPERTLYLGVWLEM